MPRIQWLTERMNIHVVYAGMYIDCVRNLLVTKNLCKYWTMFNFQFGKKILFRKNPGFLRGGKGKLGQNRAIFIILMIIFAVFPLLASWWSEAASFIFPPCTDQWVTQWRLAPLKSKKILARENSKKNHPLFSPSRWRNVRSKHQSDKRTPPFSWSGGHFVTLCHKRAAS